MTRAEYVEKVGEVDRLLNDPSSPLDPARIWSLLFELAGTGAFGMELHDECASPGASAGQGGVS